MSDFRMHSQSGEARDKPPHKDYKENLKFAKNFITTRGLFLPLGMKMHWGKTLHSPTRYMLCFVYSRGFKSPHPRFVEHVRLDDEHSAEVQKNINVKYQEYLAIAEKYNSRYDVIETVA